MQKFSFLTHFNIQNGEIAAAEVLWCASLDTRKMFHQICKAGKFYITAHSVELRDKVVIKT